MIAKIFSEVKLEGIRSKIGVVFYDSTRFYEWFVNFIIHSSCKKCTGKNSKKLNLHVTEKKQRNLENKVIKTKLKIWRIEYF